MRVFPAAFISEKNKLTGAAPVWILKFTAGGVTYYLSDNSFVVATWGITTKGWIVSWGKLQEGIGGTLDEFRISDFSVDVLVTAESPNMETLATAYLLESSTVSLYLWLYGCTDVPQEMFRGYVKDIEIPDETVVKLSLQDESLRMERAMIGTLVTRAAYPYADPDDIGKVIPIPFGTVTNLPARAVNAGVVTSLPASISALVTSFALTSGDGLVNGAVIEIDAEQILIGTIVGSQITNCTRGYNLTVAATHLKGAGVCEQKDQFDYIASAIPVTAIPRVCGRFGDRTVDITSVCTIYLGSAGSEHPSYPGTAVVSTPGRLTVSQSVDLLLNDGIAINDALSIVDDILINDNLSILSSLSLDDTIAIAKTLGLNDAIAIASTLGITDTIGVLSNIAASDSIAILNSLGINDGISILDAITISESAHTHDGAVDIRRINFTEYSVATLVTDPDKAIDNNPTSGANMASTGHFRAYTGPVQEGAPPIRARVGLEYACSGDFNFFSRVNNVYAPTIKPASTSRATAYTDWVAVTSWVDFRSVGSYVDLAGDGAGGVTIYDTWWEVEVDTTTENAVAAVARAGSVTRSGATSLTGTVSRNGTVTLTGGVSRSGSVLLGGDVGRTGNVTLTGDVTRTGGVAMDGSVTRSGGVTLSGGVTRVGGVTRSGGVTLSGNSVANTLIGDQVLCDVISSATSITDVLGWLLAEAGFAGAMQLVGNWPASYSFNGAITEYRSALYWLNELAFQARAWFKLSPGVARLIYRTDTLVPVKTIAACRISAGVKVHARRKTDYDEILNTISVLYDRDWSKSGPEAYQSVLVDSDSTSIATYGTRERPELFQFDFVIDDDMAADLLAFYLSWYKDRHWLHEFDTVLNDAELEFGDVVTLGFTGNAVAQILESRQSPGSAETSDTIGLVAVV